MAKPIWKGSIKDTYDGNEKFAGNERDAKGVNTAPGVDFLQQLYNGVESVSGFKTNLPPRGNTPTNFTMVDTRKNSTNSSFEQLNTNKGFKWDAVEGISPFSKNKTYRTFVKLV
jgi:hypothetical protein